MPVDIGPNQKAILDVLIERGDMSMMKLRRECVPSHMNLQGFDYAVGNLLRRDKINCAESDDKTKVLSLQHTEFLSQIERLILSHLVQSPEPLEKMVVAITRSLGVHENGVRAHVSRLKKRGYVEFLSSPKRAVYITEAGIHAIGGAHGA